MLAFVNGTLFAGGTVVPPLHDVAAGQVVTTWMHVERLGRRVGVVIVVLVVVHDTLVAVLEVPNEPCVMNVNCVWPGMKLVPFTVTTSPPIEFPLGGLTAVIVGVAGVAP